MKLLIFDTETTGLIPKNIELTEETEKEYPNIVQLSYVIFNTKNNKIEKTVNMIVKQKKEIAKESIKYHKITDEIAKEYGYEIDKVLEKFMDDNNEIEIKNIVAHNIYFDLYILKAEYIRYKMRTIEERKKKRISIFIDNLLVKEKYCTMMETVKYCGIKQKNGNGLKWAKLSELYEILFKIKLDNDLMHNAYYDVIVCLCCYMMYKNKINITEKNKIIAKEITYLTISE